MANSLRGLALTCLAATFATGAAGTIVPFSGTLEFDLQRNTLAGPVPPASYSVTIPVSGLANLNASSPASSLTQLSIPAGAITGSFSLPVFNAGGVLRNIAATFANDALVVQPGSPCVATHTAVGASVPASQGIRCADGPSQVAGLGGLAGNLFWGFLGSPGDPFLNLPLPLTVMGGGSTTGIANTLFGITATIAGGGWLTGQAGVVYVDRTPSGNVTFTTTITTSGAPLLSTGSGFTLSLVTPLSFQTGGAGGLNLPSFARLTLQVAKAPVPEPSAWVLMGLGMAGLALARFRR